MKRAKPWLRLLCSSLLGTLLVALDCQAKNVDFEVKRDDYGVPHVYASDIHSLYFGFGYAIAQDRLFQLEIARRTGNGSVAEVLGREYLETDIATRSSVSPSSIESQLKELPADDRAMFKGYAAGINARIREVLAEKNRLLPRQFAEYGFEPAFWTEADVVMIGVGLILNRFFGNSMEVDNFSLLQQLQREKGDGEGRKIYSQLRWKEDPRAPTIIPREAVTGMEKGAGESRAPLTLLPVSEEGAAGFRRAQVALSGHASASNMPTASSAWVVAPSRSRSGHAILYNAPQQGFSNPGFVYGVGLHGAGYNVTGMTPVGLIPVLFGTNGRIAWGSTVGSLDTNDVFQERLNPDDPHEYWFNGAYRPMNKRTDTIEVRGEEAVKVDIYSTVHGFVRSWDKQNHSAYTIKRSWEGHELETMLAWARAARSESWDEYLEYASRVSVSITWFFADSAGNIGAVGLGKLPLRDDSVDIQFPTPGDGSREWRGFKPFTHNPRSLNPKQGYLASWNNQIVRDLRADGANFSAVDRVNAIVQSLESMPEFSAQEIWDISESVATVDLNAPYFIPYILRAARDLDASDHRLRLVRLLEAWNMENSDSDGDGNYDSPAVTVFRAWLLAMGRRVFRDDLPRSVYRDYQRLGYPDPSEKSSPGSMRPAQLSKILYNALEGSASGIPQRYDFLNGSSKYSVILKALEDVDRQLSGRFGDDPKAWMTPVAKHYFPPQNALGVPTAGMGELFSVPQYLNRGTTNFLVEMRKGNVTFCSLTAPGQSGFIDPRGHRGDHYSDQMELFETSTCKSDVVVPGNSLNPESAEQ